MLYLLGVYLFTLFLERIQNFPAIQDNADLLIFIIQFH